MQVHQIKDGFDRVKVVKMWEPEGFPFEEQARQHLKQVVNVKG